METQEFWMVYGANRSAPTMQHESQVAARREAERLARQNPGSVFYVLRALMSVVVPVGSPRTRMLDVAPNPPISRCNDDDLIPF